jgi:hypothetical protein
MCTTYRFYHLCGHTHRITTIPCTYTPPPLKLPPLPEDEVVSPPPGLAHRPLLTCPSDPADSPKEIRLFPTLCAKCDQVGLISEWLNRTPGGRSEVIRAWNKTHRPELHTLESEIAEPESFDSDTATAVSSNRAVSAVAEQQAASTLVDSPPACAKPASRTGTDLSSLRERMAVLKSRIQGRIAEGRAPVR